ncbi:MAG: RNase adapter RapZ, partial [Gammaproteobacteria bacterium]
MTDSGQRRVIFVSGLSGAGKSVVLHMLEDLDFYCIDNFPIGLLEKLSEEVDEYPAMIAIGINARNQESRIPALPVCMKKFRDSNIDTELIY